MFSDFMCRKRCKLKLEIGKLKKLVVLVTEAKFVGIIATFHTFEAQAIIK